MRYIRYKDLSVYTIVKTDDWDKPLEEHPSIVEHPELYEISEEEIPEQYQYLIYQA